MYPGVPAYVVGRPFTVAVRKSKVRNDDVTSLDEEVFGLKVTMDNAGVVEEEDTSGLMKN